MIIGISTICLSLLYSILLAIVYFSKQRITNLENKVYKYLIITSILCLINELFCIYTVSQMDQLSIITLIANKIFLILLFTWMTLLCIYIISISFTNESKYKINKINLNYYLAIIYVASIIILLYLPISYYFDGTYVYSHGQSTVFLYIASSIYVIGAFISIILNYKTTPIKKYIPMFVFLFSIVVILVVRIINPGILLISITLAFVTILMFFTIENPDLKVLEELERMQKSNDSANEDKNQFLFSISENIKDTLGYAEKVIKNIEQYDLIPEIKNDIEKMKIVINEAYVRVRNTYDISTMDAKYLAPANNKYNFRLIINTIELQLKSKVKEGVNFQVYISENIPEYLYGDPVKIKQILTTIIENSIKHTHKGFIEITINSIIKYDICRLIMRFQDSGAGINILKQSEIMNSHAELTEDELILKDNLNLNIKMIRKIVAITGGTMTINSQENKGTNIEIVINQKIVSEDKEKQNLKKYVKHLENKKVIAIISEDKETKTIIKKTAKRLKIDYEIYIVAKECLDKIRNNKVFDMIFIDENMAKINAENFLIKVNEVADFNSPVIVITKSRDIIHKKNLIEKGFNNVITLPVNVDSVRENLKRLNKDNNL